MGQDSGGFTTQVDMLDNAGRVTLPGIADTLRAPIRLMTDHSASSRPMTVSGVTAMEKAYGEFTQGIGNRQRDGAAKVDATAEALADIAAVYRRVDGQ